MQRRRLAESAVRQRDELAREIQLAAEVQQSILPRSIPTVPGFKVAARMYPAKIVAGDYYGFIELPEGEIALVIADVSGKGVAAGLLMPSIEVALRMDAPRFPGTSHLLQSFNEVVCQITGGNRFISLFYGKLCPQSRSLEYTNAGHNPPLLIRADLDRIPLDKGGPVLGVLPNSDYESDTVDLRDGDSRSVHRRRCRGGESSRRTILGDTAGKIVGSYSEQSASELVETIDGIDHRASRAESFG